MYQVDFLLCSGHITSFSFFLHLSLIDINVIWFKVMHWSVNKPFIILFIWIAYTTILLRLLRPPLLLLLRPSPLLWLLRWPPPLLLLRIPRPPPLLWLLRPFPFLINGLLLFTINLEVIYIISVKKPLDF